MALSAELFFLHPDGAHFSQSDAGYWQALTLEARVMSLGWTVTYALHPKLGDEPAFGLTLPQLHAVVIDKDLHWSARAAILAHEAGHTVQPSWLNNIEGDCFAESVATLIMHDGFREHARFLAGAKWTCLGVLLAEFPSIYHAAAVLQD
jgi:hypothetical protein